MMQVFDVEIRGVHPNCFRSGEWARLVGTVMVVPEGLEQRLCHHVRFPDGVTDYWNAKDAVAQYELRAIA